MIETLEKYENVDLSSLTSLGIGGTAKCLVKPKNVNELQTLMEYIKKNNEKYYILGNGTNVILDDTYFDGIIIKFDNFKDISFDNNTVTVGSGVSLSYLAKVTLDNGFVSLNFASMIPGNVGGSVVGNAGCYGHELMEYVDKITVLDSDNNVKELSKDEISFGYRYTSLKDRYIVLAVTFILNRGDVSMAREEVKQNNLKRVSSQPLDKKSVGSIFRNPENASAGKLIDDLGLKGKIIGGACVSEKHANFIVNENNATFNDMVSLINLIKKEVKEAYQLDLVTEPVIVKWDNL